MKQLLNATNISKTYFHPQKIQVLSNISLSLDSSEAIAIMGPSGEGKTTLLHILGTIEKPNSGSLEICGKKVSLKKTSVIRNQNLGFIFQSFNLLEDFTVMDNVLMPARICRNNITKNSSKYKKALDLLEKIGLKERIFFPPKVLSEGEKQRVVMARALLNDPDIILADEPSGNLDYRNSTIIHKLLIDCAHTMQKGVIIVTHDEELANLCDKIFLLKDGKLSCIK